MPSESSEIYLEADFSISDAKGEAVAHILNAFAETAKGAPVKYKRYDVEIEIEERDIRDNHDE